MKLIFCATMLFLGGVVGKLLSDGLDEKPAPKEDSMMTWITEEADDDEY